MAFVNRVVDQFAGTMRAVTKREGSFIDTEDRLIINQSSEMAKRAKADPYGESDEGSVCVYAGFVWEARAAEIGSLR